MNDAIMFINTIDTNRNCTLLETLYPSLPNFDLENSSNALPPSVMNNGVALIAANPKFKAKDHIRKVCRLVPKSFAIKFLGSSTA